MVFNSVHFIVFFVAVYALYRHLPHRGQNWLLLAASYYFYASWDWRFLGLLLASTVVDFFCGRYIAARQVPRQRKAALILSLAFNLSMLGFFKYFNFFAENLHALVGVFGFRVDFFTLRVLLPIGISFYTFITMSYVIDVYRRTIEPARDFVEFGVFVAYFPHLVAGPILRASLLLTQISKPRIVTSTQVAEGLWLILYGFFKKMFVADNLAPLVNATFAGSANPGGLEVVLAVLAFAFQIYGDFSGYSDIAIGTSKLMGIELNLNFRFPYFVRTPQEFWANWHMSLSAWLRDYLFLPLSYAFSRRLDGVNWFGLRDDVWIYAFATMITMLLGGLWHGAAWTFVLWGAYQGVLLVAFKLATSGRRTRRRQARPILTGLGIAGMFGLTCYGWLIFRASSVTQVVSMTRVIFTGFDPSGAVLAKLGWPLLAYAAPLMALQAAEWKADNLGVVFRWPGPVRWVVVGLLVYLIVLFGNFEGSKFIYFQF
ncbi:MAG: MBOAT family protein [Acidobacteria bacterium]|nr:MBOAT family protein [Acidobacteriota bacterium]